MSRFDMRDTALAGLKVITRKRLGDNRGYLERLFSMDDLALAGWQKPIVDINHTFTAQKGTVRGMHFQNSPHAESKLVSCLAGEVWDVAVDLRASSPTFLQWHAEHLSADNGKALLIPEGFAHGFQTLAADVHMIYFHSAAYAPAHEGGLNARDPKLAIAWPLPISELSARDEKHALLTPEFEGVHP